MTEEKVKQFTKRPPAQYRRPEFYFRGGDALREQEYLQEEYKKARSDFLIAQQRLRQTQEEVQDATDVLAEREGYTNALASYLERDTQAATTENRMKNQLRQLEREIANVEVTLKEVKAYHNPAALAALQKEKAHYMIEIQRGNRTIATQDEQRDEAIRQIAACTVNGRYRESRNLEYLVEKTANKKSRLRKSVANLKKQFDVMKPKTPYQDEFSRRCRSALTANIKDQIDLFRIQEIESTRKPKHERHINDLLDQINELNQQLIDIGIPDDVVNIDEFRERVLNEDYESDDDIDEDQEEPASAEPQNNEPDETEQSAEAQQSSHEDKTEEEKKSETTGSNGGEKEKSELNTTENDFDEGDDKKSQSEKKDQSMSGDFDEDDDKKSKSATNKSMSGDFDEDDDDKKSKSTTNKSMSGDFDDDEEKKTTSAGGDDDDDEKKTTSAGGDDDDDEKKTTSAGGDDDDDEKKTTSGGGDDDDDEEKKTTSAGDDDDDDDDEKKTTSGGGDDDDDEEKKSTENDDDDDDDDEKKKSESNFDDDDFDKDDD